MVFAAKLECGRMCACRLPFVNRETPAKTRARTIGETIPKIQPDIMPLALDVLLTSPYDVVEDR